MTPWFGIWAGFRDAEAEYGRPMWETILEAEGSDRAVFNTDVAWLREEGYLS